MMRFFGIERTEAEIRPYRGIPPLGTRFDLISAHQICFNGHASSELWGVKEWDFFLGDMRENHLKPGGMIALEFNEEPSNEFYSGELRQWFEAQDARMFRGRVIIQGHPAGPAPG
jgi:hypothetical protein